MIPWLEGLVRLEEATALWIARYPWTFPAFYILLQKCLEVFRSLYRCLTFDCRQAGSKNKTKAKAKSKKKQQQQQDTMMEEGEGAEVDVYCLPY